MCTHAHSLSHTYPQAHQSSTFLPGCFTNFLSSLLIRQSGNPAISNRRSPPPSLGKGINRTLWGCVSIAVSVRTTLSICSTQGKCHIVDSQRYILQILKGKSAFGYKSVKNYCFCSVKWYFHLKGHESAPFLICVVCDFKNCPFHLLQAMALAHFTWITGHGVHGGSCDKSCQKPVYTPHWQHHWSLPPNQVLALHSIHSPKNCAAVELDTIKSMTKCHNNEESTGMP